jgi:hypothetical protein
MSQRGPRPPAPRGLVTDAPALSPTHPPARQCLLSFSRRFWRDDMYDVVAPGGFVPEFWMLQYPATRPGEERAQAAGRRTAGCLPSFPPASSGSGSSPFHRHGHTPPGPTSSLLPPRPFPGVGSPHCVVGFIAGEKADAASALGPEEVQVRMADSPLAFPSCTQAALPIRSCIHRSPSSHVPPQRRFLTQLDEIFGTDQDPRPASSSLREARIVDWSKVGPNPLIFDKVAYERCTRCGITWVSNGPWGRGGFWPGGTGDARGSVIGDHL